MLAIQDGNRKTAMDSCWQALGPKRDSPEATACYEQAKGDACHDRGCLSRQLIR